LSALLLEFGRRGDRNDPNAFQKMLAGLEAGGPHFTRRFEVGCGRLAVVEVAPASAGAGGPLLAAAHDERVALALDGRVDAWPAGAPEGAGGDAARLLARYLERGESFLDGVVGSFVVALLDGRTLLALAARDGLGNRYASYSLGARRFLLASDDAAVAAQPGVDAGLDPLRLAGFYAVADPAGPETFFRGVTALLPGELLVVGPDEVRRRDLGRPRAAARLELPRWEDYVEAFAERLRTAVERRLRGVDRATLWLSGGLDSGPIGALAAPRLGSGDRLTGLCWQVDSPAGDELELARAVGARAGFAVEAVPCADADPFRALATWPVHPSTPEQTLYREYHERCYVRSRALGADVALWGYGGDMLYAAARRWFWDLWAAAGPGRAIDRLRAAVAERGAYRVLRHELLGPVLRPHVEFRAWLPAWLTREARARLAALAPWPPDRDAARRPRQAVRLLALVDGFGLGLEAADAARHGIELRTPLRDRDLVELALAVPDHLLLQGAETRPVLRAAARGLVPEQVRLRRGKATFQAAVERALRPERRPWAGPLLRHPDALWRGFVEPAAIERWLARCPTGGEDDHGFTSAILGELWRRKRAGEDLGALDQSPG